VEDGKELLEPLPVGPNEYTSKALGFPGTPAWIGDRGDGQRLVDTNETE
jgi:hypothetical protein